MSQFTDELREFTVRIGKDGYPTALLERTVQRMEAMEAEIIRLNKSLEYNIEALSKADAQFRIK